MWSGDPDNNKITPHYKEIEMKLNINLDAQVEKMAEGFGLKEGNASIKANLELEYSVEEMLELVKMQKEILPGILSFVKEMQEISSKRYYNEEKIDKLEEEKEELKEDNRNLKRELRKFNVDWDKQN